MEISELSKKTTVNIQEKANLILAIADKLVGTYKPHEYGNVILPMCVIKRFSDTLSGTKEKVSEMNKMSHPEKSLEKRSKKMKTKGSKLYGLLRRRDAKVLRPRRNMSQNGISC